MIFRYFKRHDSRLWILATGWFTSSVGFALAIPFISIYFHSELGMSLTQIGLFFGVAAVVRSISHSLGGELSDRWGRFRLMTWAQYLRSVTFLGIAYSIYAGWGFFEIAVMILVNFVFGSVFQPAANAAVADLVPPDKRSEGYAIVRIAGNLGWAAGPAIGGYIAASSYSALFILSAIMTLISGTIISLFLRRVEFANNSENQGSWRDMLIVKGNENILRHAAIVFLLYLVIAQMIAPFSLYSVDFRGISKSQLGFLFTLNGLLVTFFQLPITNLMRRVRLSQQLVIGAAIYAAGFLLIGFSQSFALFIVAFVVITTAENFVSPPALTISANLAPEGKIGRYMGIYGFAVTAGWSLGPLLGGILLDWAKPHFIYMWAVIACLSLLAGLGFGLAAKRIPPELNLRRD